MMATGEVEENHLSPVSREQVSAAEAPSSNNPARSSHGSRSHNQNESNNRHQTKNQSTNTTYVTAPSEQNEGVSAKDTDSCCS